MIRKLEIRRRPTSGERQIVLTRTFEAPRRVVWAALCEPELLKCWLLGPAGWTMVVCENDVRVGGKFRHVWRNEQHDEMTVRGVYREVVAGERLVRSELVELPGRAPLDEHLTTLSLTEWDGKTTLTLQITYPSPRGRVATACGDVETSVATSFKRFHGLLAAAR